MQLSSRHSSKNFTTFDEALKEGLLTGAVFSWAAGQLAQTELSSVYSVFSQQSIKRQFQ